MSHMLVGLVTVFAIVLVPVYIFVLATFFGRPRAPKVSVLILGLPAALILLALVFTWGISILMSMVVP
ncbi:MAG: hypothetical protein ACE5IB_03560 [Candidatus Geothermarchaeales archaeon]